MGLTQLNKVVPYYEIILIGYDENLALPRFVVGWPIDHFDDNNAPNLRASRFKGSTGASNTLWLLKCVLDLLRSGLSSSKLTAIYGTRIARGKAKLV